MKSPQPGVTHSIVIPAFNEERLLPRTLAAVGGAASAWTERGWECEIIVCDNNSSDRTAEIARAAGARVVFEPVNQIARARNTGASVARGSWILFLDADSMPSRALFEEAAKRMESGRFVFIGATVRLDADVGAVEGVLVGAWNLLSRMLRWMAGSFVLVETGAFREAGGFSHDLYAGEEVDLSRRLKAIARRRGKRTTVIPRPPLMSSARRMKLYSRGELIRFCLRASLRPWSTTRSREACGMWYDGRR